MVFLRYPKNAPLLSLIRVPNVILTARKNLGYIKIAARLVLTALFLVNLGCASMDPRFSNTSEVLAQNTQKMAGEGAFFDQLAGFGEDNSSYTLAVMQFEDLSGTRSEGGISSAVASSGKLLTEYLLSAPQLRTKFSVYSRGALKDLLTERSLATQYEASRREKLLKKTPPELIGLVTGNINPIFDLPDMRPVDLLIYGAVVGYDKNLAESGSGAGIAGAAVRTKRSIDQLYVMVQLIETKTGRIRSVGTASQTVDSTLTSSGFLGFLSQYRILELEDGSAVNDPATIALFTALQEAILEMFDHA